VRARAAVYLLDWHRMSAATRMPPAPEFAESEADLRLRATGRFLAGIAAGLFILHASNYLYFFVDDEAIPYVFAQSLLNGNGLRYNSFEGPVEGYSNFLYLFVVTPVLASVRALHLDKITVFTFNQIWSLICGASVAWLTCTLLRQMQRIRTPGLLAGASFIVLAGPLALWSCSSLEAATFAAATTLLAVWTIGSSAGGGVAWRVAACATAVVLLRVDGVIYAGALIGTAMLVADPRHRRDLLLRVVLPGAVILAAYHLWRMWYFQELLPAPVATKVLYKLRPDARLLVKAPAENYAVQFLALYGAAPLVILCALGFAWSRNRTAVASAMAAASLTAYLAIVGDWMFGFRFFLPVLPLVAVLVANSVSAVAGVRRWLGWAMLVVVIAWFANSAFAFHQRYRVSQRSESWLFNPSLDPQRHFRRYYSLLERARTILSPGDRTAYNQAGFVPFMLDLDNIDNLGLCSPFFAHLPTTDVFMTEVGRYEPPTDKPVHRAGEAYLLYREPKFVIVPDDLLRRANGNRIPRSLYGGYYRFVFVDAAGRNVLYERTDQSVSRFKTDPRQFRENLAHVTHLTRASLDGQPVALARVEGAFPWLREGVRRLSVEHRFVADVTFADADETVYEIYVDHVASAGALTFTLSLLDRQGTAVYEDSIGLESGRARRIHVLLPQPIHASRLRVAALPRAGEAARLTIGDLRIQGQTRALATYVRKMLRFPAR
jgi:hypothetical protein